ncbi:MAG: hypothetical protein RL673_569, partial [Actinomycetota bacterium]
MFNSISPLRYRWSFPAKLFFFLLAIATLAAPIPYVFFKPGVPDNVTGRLIEINDAKSSETLYNWAIGPHVVLPRDVVYPPAVEGAVIQRDSRAEMSGSKVTATAAALSYLGYQFEEIYFISQVRDYSDAKGKLEPGDRILIVDGDIIKEIEEIRSAYSDRKIGDVIEIKVDREINGETREFVEKVRLVSNQEPGADPDRPAIGILVGTTAKFPVD